MSNAAITWAVSLKLPSSQKLVLILLANYADESGYCYPGQEAMAEKTGLSSRTIRRAIQSIEDAGLVRREKRYREDGTRNSDAYFLNVQPVEKFRNEGQEEHGDYRTYCHSLPDNMAGSEGDYRTLCPSLPDTVSANTSDTLQITTLLEAREPERDPISGLSEKLCQAAGVSDETKTPGLLSLSDPLHWINSGCDLEQDILPTLRSIAARGRRITSWAYCSRAVFEARDTRTAPPPPRQEVNHGRSHAPSTPIRESGSEQAVRILAEMSGNWDDRQQAGYPQTADPFGAPPDRGGARGELIDLVAVRRSTQPQQGRGDDAGTIPPGFDFGRHEAIAD